MTIFRLATVAIIIALASCNSEQRNLPGVDALGVYSTAVKFSGVHRVTVVREVDGVRAEWLSKEMNENVLYLHVQTGLPGNRMRVVLADDGSAVCSTDDDDPISEHPFSFAPIGNGGGPGEYVVMKTSDPKLKEQSRIILVAE